MVKPIPMSGGVDAQKKAAANWAAGQLRDGMVVGLGSRSTAAFAVSEIGRLVKAGLQTVCVPTSDKTAEQARSLGIPLSDLSEHPEIDVTIEGADEVELGTLHLIKGGGGNLLREKIVATASKRLVIVVDESKLVNRLHGRIPVEVAKFGWQSTARRLAMLGFKPSGRVLSNGDMFVTDGGNFIIDCSFGSIQSATELQVRLDSTVGVVEHGLFIGLASRLSWAAQRVCTFSSSLHVSLNRSSQKETMPTITTKDGTEIYFKDWGKGQPLVFSHGWPLTADAWEDQMIFLVARGYRCIAHDRRGHGRSGQTWEENDLDTYADDLAELVSALDLRGAIHIGHSTGGGEVTRYIGRHGTERVAKAVLIGAIPPLMLQTDKNPGGLPISAFDQLRESMMIDRAQFFKDLSAPFYGANRAGNTVSQGLGDFFWLQGMMGGHKPLYDCIKAFSETDLTEDLKRFDVPTLILHGDDDQIVPIGASALLSSKIVKGATLKVYPGAAHGMCSTLKDRVNAELLAFIGQIKGAAA